VLTVKAIQKTLHRQIRTSLRITLEALLQMIRNRRSIEEWRWIRYT